MVMAATKDIQSVPIAQLAPDLDSVDTRLVQGLVTLIWPYSSSTKTLSLLLVETDFRLRRQRGQVRVRFQGSSATVLAQHRVASGDELRLSLRAVSWVKPADFTSTPGRSIDWELSYGETVNVDVSVQMLAQYLQLILLLDQERWSGNNLCRHRSSHPEPWAFSSHNFVAAFATFEPGLVYRPGSFTQRLLPTQ